MTPSLLLPSLLRFLLALLRLCKHPTPRLQNLEQVSRTGRRKCWHLCIRLFDYECGVGIRGVVPVRIVIYSLLQLLCVCVRLFVCAVPLTSSHPVIMSEALRPRKTIVSIKGLAIIGLAVIGLGGKGILQIHAHWSLYTHTQCLRNRGVLCSPLEELPSQGSVSPYLALFSFPAIACSHSTPRVHMMIPE